MGALASCVLGAALLSGDSAPYRFLNGSRLLRARIDPGRAAGVPSTAFMVYAVERPITEVLPEALSELGGTWTAVNYVPAPQATLRRLSEAHVGDLGCPVPVEQRWLYLASSYQGCSLSSTALSVSIELFDNVATSGGRVVDYPPPPKEAEAVVFIVRPATAGDRVRAAKDWLRRLIR